MGRWCGFTAPASVKCWLRLPLIEKLRALNIRILLTSGNGDLGGDRRQAVLPADIIHTICALRFPRYVGRFLDHWRPSLALFIESDLWPNLILSSAARRLPMVLINGRMSHRSFPRWRRVAARSRRCLAASMSVWPNRVSMLNALRRWQPQRHHHGQSEAGCSAPPADSAKLERLMSVTRGRPIIVAASTHPGEEDILLDAHRALAGFFPSLLSVIVPRHPARGEAIARSVCCFRPCTWPAFRARNYRPQPPTSMLRTPWGKWDCSTGWRRSYSWAVRR